MQLRRFLIRSKELTNEVSPTLREIRENAAKASKLWPQRIWRTAVWTSIILTLTLSVIATLVIDATLKKQNEQKLAEQVARAASRCCWPVCMDWDARVTLGGYPSGNRKP